LHVRGALLRGVPAYACVRSLRRPCVCVQECVYLARPLPCPLSLAHFLLLSHSLPPCNHPSHSPSLPAAGSLSCALSPAHSSLSRSLSLPLSLPLARSLSLSHTHTHTEAAFFGMQIGCLFVLNQIQTRIEERAEKPDDAKAHIRKKVLSIETSYRVCS
jgi:hypothetical protein